MARPKGSKNKKIAVIGKEIKEGTPPISKKDSAATTSESFVVRPDMGERKPPPDADLVCECGHKKLVHYGSQYNWCNSENCRCGAWTQK